MEEKRESSHKNNKIRIEINFEELNSAPSVNVSPEVNKIPLVKELLHGKPTSFIVSGYRGAGKTSFINYLEDLIGPDKKKKEDKKENKGKKHILFVKCNFSKEESKTNILRKLIRNLWMKVQEEKEFRKIINKIQNKKLKLELDLLYKRTFYDVNETSKRSEEIVKSSELKINLLVLFILISIPIIPIFFNMNLGEILTIMKDVFSTSKWLIGSSIGGILLFLWVRRKIDKSLKEIEYKTLYDDDIAELKLLGIVKSLDKVDIKTIFVIDEMDKIDNDDNLERLISELKSLMVSGDATFVLVTGQKLYYQLERSKYLDDAILPNLFMNPYHIPLLDIDSFRKMYGKIVLNDRAEFEEAFDEYFSSIVLKSNRSPRKFLNLIRNDLDWEEDKAYIEMENIYGINTRMLESLTVFLKKENLTRYVKAQQDFLITQLHISINKILNLGLGYFDSSDIFTIDEEVNEKYPEGYWERAKKLVGLLLKQLVEDNLLELDSNTEKYTFVNYNTQPISIGIDTLIDQFIRDYDYFKMFINGIFKEVTENNGIDERIHIFDEIKELSKRNVITNSEKIKKVQKIRHMVVHNSLNIDEQIVEIREAQHNLNIIRGEILEQYTYYAITNVFSPKGYNVEMLNSKRDLGCDISANNKEVRFIFQVKVISSISSSIKQNMMQLNSTIEKISIKEGKEIIGVLVLYCSDSQIQFELDSLLKEGVNSENLITLYPNVNRDKDSKALSEYMGEVLYKTTGESNHKINPTYEKEYIDTNLVRRKS